MTSVASVDSVTSALFSEHHVRELKPQERAILARVRELTKDFFGPRAASLARTDTFARENFNVLAREGIIGTAFPVAYGGSDARQVLRIRIIEELGRVCSASASLVTGADLSGRAIVSGASDSIKSEILPQLCSGALQAAFALTEPEAGSDVRGIQTVVRRAGDHYVLNGRKAFITRGTTADWFVVIGRMENVPDVFIALLVARQTPGFAISPEIDKLGWYGVPISSLTFKDVNVPVKQRLGEEGQGFSLAQDALLRARIGHAAMALGRAMGAVEIAAAYMADRQISGKILGDHQGPQWMLADMMTQIEAARALVVMAAQQYDVHGRDAAIFASMAKLYAADLGMKVVTDCLQLTGGRGYLKNFPLERFFRDAKLNQIGEGSSEVHKTVIGRHAMRRIRQIPRNPCLRSDLPADDWEALISG